MADTTLTPPAQVVLSSDYSPSFTPRELDLIKTHTGRSFSAIIADDDSDERITVTAWLKLRRDGYLIDLDEMRDVVITLTGAAPDPTNGAPSSSSSSSAASGA